METTSASNSTVGESRDIDVIDGANVVEQESDVIGDGVDVCDVLSTNNDDVARGGGGGLYVGEYSACPRLVAQAQREFDDDNYLRGCKWSPCGHYVATNSEDHVLRVFVVPDQIMSKKHQVRKADMDLCVICRVREPEVIYDYCWLQGATRHYLLSTSQGQPIHLYCPLTGLCKGTYKAHDHVDEPVTAHSLCVSECTDRIYAGYVKYIRVFDINRPGYNIIERKTAIKHYSDSQKGIISCIDYNHTLGLYAAGCYDKTVALYNHDTGQLVSFLRGHTRGVTHLTFSTTGTYLYTGTRMGGSVFGWDVRSLSKPVYQIERSVHTNQRFYFSLLGWSQHHLISGHDNGVLSVWPSAEHSTFLLEGAVPCATINVQAHMDACTSVSVHPQHKCVATGSGQRHLYTNEENGGYVENCLRIWSL